MKKERKNDIRLMADAIDDHRKHPMTIDECYKESSVSPTIERKMIKSPDEIIATKKLEIPKCLLTPVNGRIYLVEVASSEMRSPGGLILPQLYAVKKNEQMADIKRYFVVAWDKIEIPKAIQDQLEVGIEVNPFLPEHAEEWDLPRVIDWQACNVFKVAHYTELAGISSIKPEIVEK
jgi:hypothetical protein